MNLANKEICGTLDHVAEVSGYDANFLREIIHDVIDVDRHPINLDAYKKGEIDIHFHFRHWGLTENSKNYCAVFKAVGSPWAAAAGKSPSPGMATLGEREDGVMFVHYVHPMDEPGNCRLGFIRSRLERLQPLDLCEYVWSDAWKVLRGGLLKITLLREDGVLGSRIRSSATCFDKEVSEIVEGAPKLMNNLPAKKAIPNEIRLRREIDAPAMFSEVSVVLGGNGMGVLIRKGCEHSVQCLDVFFGARESCLDFVEYGH